MLIIIYSTIQKKFWLLDSFWSRYDGENVPKLAIYLIPLHIYTLSVVNTFPIVPVPLQKRSSHQ